MKKIDESLFQLYKKVQMNDKEAKKELLGLHKSKWPHHHKDGKCDLSLHTIYLHLTK